jgi:hypothetical protein
MYICKFVEARYVYKTYMAQKNNIHIGIYVKECSHVIIAPFHLCIFSMFVIDLDQFLKLSKLQNPNEKKLEYTYDTSSYKL